MSVFDNPAFDHHERVLHCTDPASGLAAIIAIHSTARGPSAGGCRFWHYASPRDAITDALRLSRGMSYKNAMAELPLGGGKAVILAPADRRLTDELLIAFGRFVDTLRGAYITAEDVGMTVEAMQVVASQTRFVAGLPPEHGKAGGDPSPKTAIGVYQGILAAVAERLDRTDVNGLHVAVQGVGHVGMHLVRLLTGAGARVTVADMNEARVRAACAEYGAEAASLEEILVVDADVLAPCALGSVLNEQSIPRLGAGIVAGAANNQLATDADGQRLYDRGILYAPDYVINAGGIINVSCEFQGGMTDAEVDEKVVAIGPRIADIFAQSREQGIPTNVIADRMARERIGRA